MATNDDKGGKISFKDWDISKTEQLLEKSASDLVNIMVNSKAGEARREIGHQHRLRQTDVKDQEEMVNEILDFERQSELYEALEEDFQGSLPKVVFGSSRKRRENPIEEVLALEEGMDKAVRAMSRRGNKAKNLMVGSFVAKPNKPVVKNRVTTWVRLRKKKARARDDRKKDDEDSLVVDDDVEISSGLKLANQDNGGLINKKGDYERTTNTPGNITFQLNSF